MAETLAPRLEACYFQPAQAYDPFERFAVVLRETAIRHCQGWQVNVERIVPAPRRSAIGKAAHVANAQKIERWASLVRTAEDGQRLLLIDTDTAIFRPLDDVWDLPFDFAYTVKRRPYPYNLGVLFVRVSPAVRSFFATWLEENIRMLEEVLATEWRKTHGGINQASFARLLERGALGALRVQTLPCAEWNCEESGWSKFDPRVTRILHVKGELRRAIESRQDSVGEMDAALAAYRALEPARRRRSA